MRAQIQLAMLCLRDAEEKGLGVSGVIKILQEVLDTPQIDYSKFPDGAVHKMAWIKCYREQTGCVLKEAIDAWKNKFVGVDLFVEQK